MFSLKGKIAVITGGGSGIGLAAADAYAEAGAKVILTYKSNDKAKQEAEKLAEKWNTEVTAVKLEVTSLAENVALVEEIVKRYGRIDIWVSNAGVGQECFDIIDGDVDDFNATIDTNFRAVVWGAKAVGSVFRKQGSGSFIVTASAAATVIARPISIAIYNATKAAVRHFATSLAYEWRDFARVNSVSPGYFLTSLGAAPEELDLVYTTAFLGRQGNTKELKGIYLYLASDASTYTTGADMLVDGGITKA